MNEDYCSYELSKALKAAGFDEPCDAFYLPPMKNRPEPFFSGRVKRSIKSESNAFHFSAPTLWQAQKWLREKGIAVSVQANEIQGELWYSADIVTTKGVNELVDGGFDYINYEAALSAGISAALELIKKGE